MNFVEIISDLDQTPELHIARLLILINEFTEDKDEGSIEGLTKLAKLDFLLRYPVMLEKALKAKNKSTKNVMVENHEYQSVESEMVRYRFGPWDYHYRNYLNILVAKGLVFISIEGRKIVISLTEAGIRCANSLAQEADFEPYVRRSKLIKCHFNLTATNLMRFIYNTFPEIISLNSGKRITI